MAGENATVDEVAGEFADLDFLDMAAEADSEEAALSIPDKPDPDAKPEDGKPADAKPEDGKPADAKPEDGKPADAKPEDKSVDAKPEDKPDADEEQTEIETVVQLAEAMGSTPEDVLKGLTHTVKVGDEEKTVPLSELADRYAEAEGVTAQIEAFNTERQTTVESMHQQSEEIDTAANAMVALYGQLEAEADEALTKPELVTLKTEDPAQYALRVQEVRDAKENIGKARDRLVSDYQAYVGRQRQHILQQEGQRLLRVVPGWTQDHLKKSWTALMTQGFSHNELQQNLDSRILVVGHELAKLQAENAELRAAKAAGKQAADTVKRKVPKFVLKGGKGATPTRQPGATASADVSARVSRARKSGSLDDAVAAAMHMPMDVMET